MGLSIMFLVLGVVAGLFMPDVGSEMSPYVAASILAALDSVLGGIIANLNKKFNFPIFVSGFFTNALLAAILTYLGNKLGINLYMAAIFVFGTRIFNDFATMRHLLIGKYYERKNSKTKIN
jgi:small basic protein